MADGDRSAVDAARALVKVPVVAHVRFPLTLTTAVATPSCANATKLTQGFSYGKSLETGSKVVRPIYYGLRP